MTGKELWTEYQRYTRDSTEHGRKLGFGGAAICWLFKTTEFTFPVMVYLAMLSFVAYFICDILHGVAGALMIKFFTERAEKELWEKTHSIEGDIAKPRWVDFPAQGLFVAKFVFLILGFVFIGCELLWRLVR